MAVVKGIGNDLVREARLRAGLTQAELARRVGSTQSAIARVEGARTAPSFDKVLELVRACGLDLDVMLVERDDSDLAQAVRLTGLTAEERVRRADHVRRVLNDFREAGERQRASGA